MMVSKQTTSRPYYARVPLSLRALFDWKAATTSLMLSRTKLNPGSGQISQGKCIESFNKIVPFYFLIYLKKKKQNKIVPFQHSLNYLFLLESLQSSVNFCTRYLGLYSSL
jgi:hypothetical protein